MWCYHDFIKIIKINHFDKVQVGQNKICYIGSSVDVENQTQADSLHGLTKTLCLMAQSLTFIRL